MARIAWIEDKDATMHTKQLRVASRDFLFVLAVLTLLGVLVLLVFATVAQAQ